ncbi:myosin-10-like [Protopterus annectens]|uniref:myosin-10-like n=1 Tax=Protopterus annectens TaxID=7888 RepID=UPI001CFB806B|nr:myosin-10-like [Protopterus annectens]
MREKARKASSSQPKATAEAENMLKKMKALQSQISTLHMEIDSKENSIKFLKSENKQLSKNLQTMSDNVSREKQLLMEEISQMKKLTEVVKRDISYKEAELVKLKLELEQSVNTMQDKEHDIRLLEVQLTQHVQQHEAAEAQLADKRSEFLKLQASLHQLEEKYYTSTASLHDQIAKDLRAEIRKLRQQLRDKELSAEEDTYLRNKLTEDCGYLTKTNAQLQSQILELTSELERERLLQDKKSTWHSRNVSELSVLKEQERGLEKELIHLKRLLEEENKKVLSAVEQLRHLEQERSSAQMHGLTLQTEVADLQDRHSALLLENTQFLTEKSHLVEHISQLNRQIAEKEDELHLMKEHTRTLSYDVSSLRSQLESEISLQSEMQKEFSILRNGMK